MSGPARKSSYSFYAPFPRSTLHQRNTVSTLKHEMMFFHRPTRSHLSGCARKTTCIRMSCCSKQCPLYAAILQGGALGGKRKASAEQTNSPPQTRARAYNIKWKSRLAFATQRSPHASAPENCAALAIRATPASSGRAPAVPHQSDTLAPPLADLRLLPCPTPRRQPLLRLSRCADQTRRS